MCFSAQADLTAGVVVTAVGIDAIRRARTPRELPLASLPLLLGIHTLIEAFVWWGLAGTVSQQVGDAATWFYLAIAFLLPVWVPIAVRGVEPVRARRRLMSTLAGIGAVATLVFLWAIVFRPIGAYVDGMHIAYVVDLPGGGGVGVIYVVATCGALVMASDRWIRYFGFSNLVAVIALAWLTVGGLTSLWCVWAAITSFAIDLYLREDDRRPDLAYA